MQPITVIDIAQTLDGYVPVNSFMISASIAAFIVSVYFFNRNQTGKLKFLAFLVSSAFLVVSLYINIGRSIKNSYIVLRAEQIHEAFYKYQEYISIYQLPYSEKVTITVTAGPKNKNIETILGVDVTTPSYLPYENITIEEFKRIEELLKQKDPMLFSEILYQVSKQSNK